MRSFRDRSAIARGQKAMRSVRARVGRVASFLHFLYEPSGHDSTVSRCATGSNPRNPQSQRCGPRGARTRTVWYDARSASGKGKRVLGRSRWDCGLRRCEARRCASGIRSRNASGSDVNPSGRSSTAGSPSRATSTSAPSSTVNAGAENAGNPGTQGLVPVASVVGAGRGRRYGFLETSSSPAPSQRVPPGDVNRGSKRSPRIGSRSEHDVRSCVALPTRVGRAHRHRATPQRRSTGVSR
jgi:hypothetical protein